MVGMVSVGVSLIISMWCIFENREGVQHTATPPRPLVQLNLSEFKLVAPAHIEAVGVAPACPCACLNFLVSGQSERDSVGACSKFVYHDIVSCWKTLLFCPVGFWHGDSGKGKVTPCPTSKYHQFRGDSIRQAIGLGSVI